MLMKYVLKYSLKCLVISEESNNFQGSMKKRERERRKEEREGGRKGRKGERKGRKKEERRIMFT